MGKDHKHICNEPDEAVVQSAKVKAKKEIKAKVPWYFANGFLVFWGLVFFAVVVPLFNRLPTPLTTDDDNKGVFIAQRAEGQLYNFSIIGPKPTASDANEITTTKFLLTELLKIKAGRLVDYFDIEIDLQQPSGAYVLTTMINMYQGLQNIVVKFNTKNSTSETYLLVNSHFDSKITSPGAGDAGLMVVSMLEVLRVMSTTKKTFDHPIIFLFNGAEENPLQASHGFISQHKWAKYCKAVINLDAAGSGGREILFQGGPYHPWLMSYYKKYAKHPFATAMAEEIFQSGIIPSDTDFRIFRDYGKIPGLDFAQCVNGFVYHTKYDRIDVIPRASIQNTGENLLSLVQGLSNATELYDTSAYASGNAVFFDVLGLYFITYSASTGVILNYATAGAALILVFISIWRIAAVSNTSITYVFCWFILVQIVQLIGFVLGLGLPVAVAYVFDYLGLSLTYFSTPWFLIGLYICPSLIGLSLPITFYFAVQRNKKISLPHHLQLALHGQAIILALLVAGITYYGLRSAYIVTIPLIFYVASLALNLLTTLHDRGYSWSGLLKVGQVIPFLYSSYLIYTFVVVLIPMMGRFGTGTNPDLIIAGLSALGTILSLGFLIPLINMFRRPCFVLLSLIAVTGITCYLATTQLGFPYRPKTNVGRMQILHVRRVFYEYDGTISSDESGYYFDLQDRRGVAPIKPYVNLTGLVSIESDCNTRMMCGIPLYDRRWVKSKLRGKWLPRQVPLELPGKPVLNLVSKTVLATGQSVRLVFNLTGPDHMSIFIQPNEDVQVSNWSFLQSYLQNAASYSAPPYHIFFTYAIDSTPLTFWVEITKTDGDFNVPLFQLGISGHYMKSASDATGVAFISRFPSYIVPLQWPASYQRFIF